MTGSHSTCKSASIFALSSLLLCCTAAASAQQGFVGSTTPAPSPSAPKSPSTPTTPAPLPDAPSAGGAAVLAVPSAAERPLVLPRNWQMTPGSSRSNMPRKVRYYLGSTWSIRNLLEASAVSGIPNITAAPVQPQAPTSDDPTVDKNYQNAMDTYGDEIDTWRRVNEVTLRNKADRFEVGLATAETRQLFSNLVLPLTFHQEARFIPSPVNSDLSQRMWNAVSSIVVTRNDAGMLVPNYSKLGGTVIAAFLGKSFYASAFHAPELNSGHFVEHYVAYSLLGDLATNTAHELLRAAREPDMSMFDLHGRSTDDSYYPLSLGGKLVYWGRSTYAMRNFVTAGLIADIPNIVDRPKEPEEGQPLTWNGYPDYDTAYNNYGESVLGWKQSLENNVRYHERRLFGGLAESESQMLLQNLVIPVAFNMDPRYVPLGASHSAGDRLAHAFTGLVIAHTDSGARTINLPLLGGTFGAAFAAKEFYYPQLGTPALATNAVLTRTVGLNLAADTLGNIVGEFFRHRTY